MDSKVEAVEDEEDPYYNIKINDEEYDTIMSPSSSDLIANRPPAPAPRPKSLPTAEEKMSFIAQGKNKDISLKTEDCIADILTFRSFIVRETWLVFSVDPAFNLKG